MDLERVIALFTGKNSEDLYDRHLSAIERLCQSNATGFAIKDLPKVQQILEITLRLLLKGVPGFLQPAVSLLRVLSKPFVKKTATDEFRLLGNISNILACVGQILTTNGYPADLQLAASELFIVFASGYGQRPSLLDKLPPVEQIDCGASARQYHTNQMLINSSGVLVAVIKSLAAAVSVGDEIMMMSLSLVASQISYFPDNAKALLDAGLLHSLPHLFTYDYRHPITPVAVQLLWNLLEFATVETRVGLVTTPAPHGQYTDVLETKNNQQEEEQDRNEGAREGGVRGQQGDGQLAGSKQDEEPRKHSNSGAPKGGREEDGPVSWSSQTRESLQSTLLASQPRSRSPPSKKIGSQPTSILPGLAISLASLFRTNLLQGFRSVDKELRNDLVVLCSLIIGSDHHEAPPAPAANASQTAKPADVREQTELLRLCSSEFIEAAREAGLFEALLAVATSPELGLAEHPSLVKAWALSTEELDYELKQLAWRTVVSGCVHAGPEEGWFLLDAARAWALMRALLAFVEEVPEAAPHASLAAATQAAQRRWSPDQMDALRAAALARLHALAPLCPEVYVEEGGPAVLLRFLSNSVHAVHMEGALRHLHNLVVSKACAPQLGEENGMEAILGAAGAISTLLTLLQDGSRPEGVRHCCLLLLAALCRKSCMTTGIKLRNMIGEASSRSLIAKSNSWNTRMQQNKQSSTSLLSTRNSGPITNTGTASSYDGDLMPCTSNLKRFRHDGGVGMVLSQLLRCRSIDQTLPSPYTVAVLDVIWTCVVPDRKNTARFLVEDGLDALLSLLEVGNRGHRAVGLSLLADILSNPRSHSFFHDWRSHQDQSTAAHLLLRIWKEEDQAGGISNAQGVLANTTLPLRGTGNKEAWVSPEAISYGTLLPGTATTVDAGAAAAGATASSGQLAKSGLQGGHELGWGAACLPQARGVAVTHHPFSGECAGAGESQEAECQGGGDRNACRTGAYMLASQSSYTRPISNKAHMLASQSSYTRPISNKAHMLASQSSYMRPISNKAHMLASQFSYTCSISNKACTASHSAARQKALQDATHPYMQEEHARRALLGLPVHACSEAQQSSSCMRAALAAALARHG